VSEPALEPQDLRACLAELGAAEDEAIEAFVDYMLSDEGLAAVSEVGYVDLNGADSARAKTVWAARLTGQGQWSED